MIQNQFSVSRCYFLSMDSDEDWFKRKSCTVSKGDSSCIYGKFSKVLGYIIPVKDIWPALHDVFCEKARFIIPVEDNSSMKNVYMALSGHYDSLYAPGESASLPRNSDEKSEILAIFSKLTEDDKERFMDYVRAFKTSKDPIPGPSLPDRMMQEDATKKDPASVVASHSGRAASPEVSDKESEVAVMPAAPVPIVPDKTRPKRCTRSRAKSK